MRTILLLLVVILFMPHAAGQQFILLNKNWKACRASEVPNDGAEITGENFHPSGWIDAVVPGTVLTTLLHNKLVPDPFYGLNNELIPDVNDAGRDYYTFWFLNDFQSPVMEEDDEVWLCLRGINYFAEVFLNGYRVNTKTHEGMFLREKYLITPYLRNDRPNRLAVWVAPPDPAGKAGIGQGGDGKIGRNVTMQFTVGWDWICPIKDRNTGIWDQVALEVTGPADIRNSFVRTSVPGIRIPGKKQDPAYIEVTTEIKNASRSALEGYVTVEYRESRMSIDLLLFPGEEKIVEFPEIIVREPDLWWPNGLGEHPLQKLILTFFDREGFIVDTDSVTFGIRETGNYFDEQVKAQVFTVNGQKVFIKGGNWIASDALLRLSEERYDAEVRLHAEMNMNMIRVWGGGLTERPEFYDACDRHGMLVWQDLWISGDCNGEWNDPVKESRARRKAYPDDHDLFLRTVIDQVKMLRNHPALFMWCGGNETYPPDDILYALENEIFPWYDPGRFFLDKSTSPKLMTNSYGDTGDGPYNIREPHTIFTEKSFPFNPETGSVGIPEFEGIKRFIPEEDLFPPDSLKIGETWTYHKYLPFGNFITRYGDVKNIEDFCFKAQIVSYEQYRTLAEAFNHKMWEWYSGMLVWKTQNPWTALRGSFYDYYLDYEGGYFGYKHGAAPVHIQFNLNDSSVCVLNQTASATGELTAIIGLFDIHGYPLWEKAHHVNPGPNEMIHLDHVVLPEDRGDVLFLRLSLMENNNIEDQNLYWLSVKKGDYRDLNNLRKAQVSGIHKKNEDGSYTITISNTGDETAFFIRVKSLDEKNEPILPVYFTDNYFTLFPGEEKEIKISSTPGLADKIFRFFIEGWNFDRRESVSQQSFR